MSEELPIIAPLKGVERLKAMADHYRSADPLTMFDSAGTRELDAAAIDVAIAAMADVEVYRAALGLACSDGWSDGASAMLSYIETARDHVAAVAALYPEAGK